MRTTKRHYKDVIRGRMISMRLTEEEFLLIKMGALREKTSVSGLMRRGVAGLIEGVPTEAKAPMTAVTAPTGTLPEATEAASAAAPSAAVASPVTPDVEATPAATPVAPQAG